MAFEWNDRKEKKNQCMKILCYPAFYHSISVCNIYKEIRIFFVVV